MNFKPTYKFDVHSDVYDSGLKKRIPAWTDRILYAPTGIKCMAYDADFSLRTSDHRPVYATFSADISLTEDMLHLMRTLAGVDTTDDASALKYNGAIEFSSESQVCTIS